MNGFQQQQSAQAAYLLSGLDLLDAWLAYYGTGGQLSEMDIDAYLHGLWLLPVLQRDLIASALNEYLSTHDLPELAFYSDSSGE
ncbi:hypothetical protein [Arthrobacter globiformis]|uniref:hypothetical protein n=1 Tax=Arthrobacter globiformis TaxID=1665 RepID=UPI000B41E5E7|nr:hypothetical protein [Arthrobacter globiformis]